MIPDKIVFFTNSEAGEIKDAGIKSGKDRERLAIRGAVDQFCHLIAMHQLSESGTFLGKLNDLSFYLSGYNWKPFEITENGETTRFIINVSSAVNRLAAMGLDKQEIKEVIYSGDFQRLAQLLNEGREKQWEKHVGRKLESDETTKLAKAANHFDSDKVKFNQLLEAIKGKAPGELNDALEKFAFEKTIEDNKRYQNKLIKDSFQEIKQKKTELDKLNVYSFDYSFAIDQFLAEKNEDIKKAKELKKKELENQQLVGFDDEDINIIKNIKENKNINLEEAIKKYRPLKEIGVPYINQLGRSSVYKILNDYFNLESAALMIKNKLEDELLKYNLINVYQKAMDCDEDTANLGIKAWKSKGATEKQISKEIEFINLNKEKLFAEAQAKKSKGKKDPTVYISTKEGRKDGLKTTHYGLLFTAEGRVFVSFGKTGKEEGEGRHKFLKIGSFKRVKESLNLNSGKIAIKATLKTSDEMPLEKILKELEIMKAIGPHKNIVRFDHETLVIVPQKDGTYKIKIMMENCNGGELFDAISKKKLSIKQKNMVCENQLDAFKYAKSKGYVHADYKPENVFLIKNEKGEIIDSKLGDFGLSYSIKNKDLRFKGSAGYVAPELIKAITGTEEEKKKANDFPLDAWAFGTMLYVLYYERVPSWFDKKEKETLRKTINFDRDTSKTFQRLKNSKGTIDNVIYGLLDPNPDTRMTLEEAKNIFDHNGYTSDFV